MPSSRLFHLLNLHPKYSAIKRHLARFNESKNGKSRPQITVEGEGIRYGHQPANQTTHIRRPKPLKFLM